MSATASHHQSDLQDYAAPQFPCERDGCDAEFPEREAVKGSYCSLDCYHRAKGAAALSEIRRDHRFCATCFRKLKDVVAPTKEDLEGVGPVTSEAVIGFQFRRPEGEPVVDVEGDSPHTRQEFARIGCVCGNVDHTTRDETLESLELKPTVINLFDTLQLFEAEGKIAHRPDWARLRDSLREEWRDWELAIGRALYD